MNYPISNNNFKWNREFGGNASRNLYSHLFNLLLEIEFQQLDRTILFVEITEWF